METRKLLLAIVGPTASGKSTLAVRLALRLKGEIVNCDSMQMVRGMNIGTAKPSPSERQSVPHHLFDRVNPDEYFSAGQYMDEAREVCLEIAGRGRIPIVVGGTGLYLKAFLEGVFTGPGRSEELRSRLGRIAERRGNACLFRILQKHDPRAAERIPVADLVRLVRALEVFFLTGQSITSWQPDREPLIGFQVLKLGIRIARENLYDRINRRVTAMFKEGLVEEVEGLLATGYSIDSKGFEAIGYRHVAAFLQGELTEQEAVEKTCQETRRYAKRQMTWFRKDPGIKWLEFPGESSECFAAALEHLGKV